MGENGWNQDVEGVNTKRMCQGDVYILSEKKIKKKIKKNESTNTHHHPHEIPFHWEQMLLVPNVMQYQ